MSGLSHAQGIDVLRDVGGGSPRSDGRAARVRHRLRTEALRTARDESLVEATYGYRIVPLDAPPAPGLRAGGETLHAPWLLPPSGRLPAGFNADPFYVVWGIAEPSTATGFQIFISRFTSVRARIGVAMMRRWSILGGTPISIRSGILS